MNKYSQQQEHSEYTEKDKNPLSIRRNENQKFEILLKSQKNNKLQHLNIDLFAQKTL